MFSTESHSRYYKTYNLPPMTVKKSQKKKDKWKHGVLDGFERIALDQFTENLEFVDLYRMVEGKLTYQELSEVAPHFSSIQDVLDGVGIPSFLRHYDIIGTMAKGLTGILIQMQDKFHVTDTGEIAKNDYLRYKTQELQKMLQNVLENTVNRRLAESGFKPEDMQKFEDEQQKQAYLQQLDQAKEAFTPKDTRRTSKNTFKTVGVQWGEATLDHDKERFNFSYLDKENFKHFFISGRCFRHFRIGFDEYVPEIWSAKNTFWSKEVDSKLVHKGEYIGNIDWKTPAQVVRTHGHLIDTKTQKELLGGDESWGSFVDDGFVSGGIEQALASNLNKQVRTPFSGYFDYTFYLDMQEETGLPLGVQTVFNEDGTTSQRDRYLPRMAGNNAGSIFDGYAAVVRDDFTHRTDLCQVTEVYFRAYDLFGYLTYEDEYGATVTEEVTEDILPEFLKENNIKASYTSSIVDVIEDFEPGTLKWMYRPIIYKGIKVQSANLKKPLYLRCDEFEHQIKGDSEFDRWLPVAGYIGTSIAKKIEPYQAKHNLCMNQVYSLLEKELGVFFLMDIAMIPSEFDGWGDAQEALMAVRNIAKDTGILPVATAPDGQGPVSPFNQFSTNNLSNSSQIADRLRIAEVSQNKAWEVIGMNPSTLQQATKYETAEGVRQSQEAGWAQLAEIFEDFNLFVKASRELHLSVAQYAQSNKKDQSLYYTKSDGSIEYLKVADPNFPLRRLGLIATMDSSKRKELETFKAYILQNNTLNSDMVELAKLVSSDAMSEAVEIARIAQERREERENQIRQEQATLQQRDNQAKAEREQAAWERLEVTNQRDRENRLQEAEIMSLGRASDKKSDMAGIQQIKTATDQALKQTKIQSDEKVAIEKLRSEDKHHSDAMALKMAELKLKAKQLRDRQLERQSEEYIATINKN